MKGRLWCADLPTVTVPITDTPKPVTLVLPYYDNPVFFGQQVKHWRALPEALRRYLSVIVVDDCSQQHPASDVLENVGRDSWLRLFRIDRKVPWNWLAARNRGAHEAKDGCWLLMTDMDHVLPAETLHGLVYGKHDPTWVYGLQRREHTGELIHPHSASFFMTKAMFWHIGGYNELLSGWNGTGYGTDGVYRARLARRSRICLSATDYLIRHEYQGDSSTVGMKRKSAVKGSALRDFIKKLDGKHETLKFPYHEVLGVPAHA